MNTVESELSYPVLQQLTAPPKWEAFQLKVSGFPLRAAEKHAVRYFLDTLSKSFAAKYRLSLELFLEFNELHRAGNLDILRAHAKAWMPEVGLGVWIDRAPPTLWSEEEFEDLAPGEVIRPLMHPMLRITTGNDGRHDARNRMCGRGVLVQVMAAADNAILTRMKNCLLPKIIEPAYQDYPFYLSLLEPDLIKNATHQILNRTLGGAKLYIRESVRDCVVLILSRLPLESVIREIVTADRFFTKLQSM